LGEGLIMDTFCDYYSFGFVSGRKQAIAECIKEIDDIFRIPFDFKKTWESRYRELFHNIFEFRKKLQAMQEKQ
jgi:hypothetical protein